MILNYIFGSFCNKIGCVFEIVIDGQILWIVVMQIVSNVILKRNISIKDFERFKIPGIEDSIIILLHYLLFYDTYILFNGMIKVRDVTTIISKERVETTASWCVIITIIANVPLSYKMRGVS